MSVFRLEITLLTVSFSHLHYNVIQRVCLTDMLDYVVMQMRKVNRVRGFHHNRKALITNIILLLLMSACVYDHVLV